MGTTALTGPSPDRVLKVPVSADDHIAGDPNAPVVLVQYGDLECPYCEETYPVIERLRRLNMDDMAFVFRHFPRVDVHRRTRRLAEVVEAAALQRRFWAMRALVFGHASAIDGERVLVYARSLHLDVDRFVDDLGSGAVAAKIRRDARSGVASGVRLTPTLFVNGVPYAGGVELEELGDALESAATRSRR
jgi:Na+:H+ antiporter, NhaA family